MHKQKNIVLSILLALSLVLGTLSPAFADDFTSNGEITTSETQVQQGTQYTLDNQDNQPVQDSIVAQNGSDNPDGSYDASDDSNQQSSAEPEDLLPSREVPSDPVTDDITGAKYDANTVIVVFESTIPNVQVIETLTETEAVEDQAVTEITNNPGTDSDKVVVAEVSTDANVAEAIDELSQMPGVLYAQPNFVYSILEGEPDDEYLLTNQPYLYTQSWIGATRAWTLAKSNHNVGIAVIDTGVYKDHPDLKANIVDYYDASTKKNEISDPHGHGTHVAGIAAASTYNGIGVSSISYNASLLPIKIMDSGGQMLTSYILEAYSYLQSKPSGSSQTIAQKYNIRVVNMSVGGPELDKNGDTLPDDGSTFSGFSNDALFTAIDEAYNAGILTVCAAGNNGSYKYNGINKYIDLSVNGYINYPSDYEKCISVINLEEESSKASSSNYGREKDISAPGYRIYSTTRNGSYGENTGTSMASPVVAGAAALCFSVKPAATPAEVRAALEGTATDIAPVGKDDLSANGRLNAYAAVKSLREVSIQNSGNKFSVNSNLLLTDWKWSVANGTGSATIDSNSGVLTPVSTGTVTVTVTSASEADIFASKVVSVTAVGGGSVNPLGIPSLSYRAHIQDVGDGQGFRVMGEHVGTTGSSKRLEGITLKLGNEVSGLGIRYTTHIQDLGWENTKVSWKTSGQESGSRGSSKRLEAIKIELTGTAAANYDIYYQVHAQDAGWLAWAKNGQEAGSAGFSYRLEAIRIVIVAKGGDPNTVAGLQAITGAVQPVAYLDSKTKGDVAYTATAHIQNLGNRSFTNLNDYIGTAGQSLRVEALTFNSLSLPLGVTGSIQYRTHIQNDGDQAWTNLGALSGTTAESKRLEAINIRLTGDLAQYYDVYYRTHVQNIGWTGWSKNGTDAANKATWSGSVGYGYRMEAMQVVIVAKGGTAPGIVGTSYYKK